MRARFGWGTLTVHRAAGVVLDGQEVALAALLARLGVAWLERRDGAAPPGAVRLRDQLAAFARESTTVLVGGERENGKTSAAADVPQSLSTAQAGALLGLTRQRTDGLCRSGDLLARRDSSGRWVIDPGSVAAMAARRKEGA